MEAVITVRNEHDEYSQERHLESLNGFVKEPARWRVEQQVSIFLEVKDLLQNFPDLEADYAEIWGVVNTKRRNFVDTFVLQIDKIIAKLGEDQPKLRVDLEQLEMDVCAESALEYIERWRQGDRKSYNHTGLVSAVTNQIMHSLYVGQAA
jgi:hypothetical protein